MDKNKALESVNEIKELMEKSSKFVSLSGMTAVLAGMYALAGAFVAGGLLGSGSRKELIVIASAILAASVITACILSWYKAKKMGQKLFSKLTYRIAWNFALPLLTGGLFCIALLLHEVYGLISSVMLLFYGLSLVNVSKFTYSNVAWLGYAFLGLGILDCFFEGHGLLFWTIGFGGFHVLYGVLFYLQYERNKG
ncbi:hypothetical protein [Bacteroides sp.]|uniref:hypothetical protein n=1 Tax=Bacteroides sp. TaxID=29523 RepID=UPI003AB11FF5